MVNKVMLLLFLSFAFSGFSQDFKKMSNPATCKTKLENKSKTTSTITASFSEEVYSSMFNNPKTGTGTLNYKKEGKIRWEKKTPQSEIILISGKSIRMKQDGKEVSNAISNKIAKKMQDLMLELVSSNFLSEKDFSISYYESSKEYKLLLKPKSARLSKYISTIELYFTKSNLALDKIILFESEDDYVSYSFSSVTFNSAIAESTFTTF